ncbi:MAG TPA: alcohol dehydrogenase catalytic domain-containing protein [Thermoanaerobaculia bacterium]|jgi:D-arabinose 1-dehydrogenase-like Zn-dependent alcohol dehydrogenase
MPTKMRAFAVPKPGAPFQRLERDVPDPGPGQVRVRVHANGICHSDVLTKEGAPGIDYPRVPGHEVAGVVDAVGAGVEGWAQGERVGIGWHGGHCGRCQECRKGNFRFCLVSPLVTGISYDGGYADYVIAPAVALARIPDGLSFVEAAPLMDAGVTTFMGLRHSGAQAGDLVAVLGVGGLGHLGVQFAAKMGFDTVAIARGADKKDFVEKLGARAYIDTEKQDAAAELTKLGGARAILATATSGAAMTAVIEGLGVDGVLEIVGAPTDPVSFPAYALIRQRRSIAGWASGRPVDSEATMKFAVQTGVRSMNELYPLEKAAEAYDRMLSGKARFRVVMTTE